MILRLPTVLIRSGVLFLLVCGLPLQAGEGESVFRWTQSFLKSVRQDSTAPAQVSRRLAILYLAARDAHALGEKPYLKSVSPPDTLTLDREAAALGALYEGVQLFYPSHRARYRAEWDSFQKKRQEAGISADLLAASVAYGKSVAFAHLKAREGDGATNKITFVPSEKVGQWRRTPPSYRPPELPHWGKVSPFLLLEAHQFRPPAPPALDSPAYQAAVEEVRKIGGKKANSSPEDAKEVAHFWSCFSYTSTPSGHWNTILIELFEKSSDSTFAEVLHAFAVLNVTLADTAIACWEAKYHYRLWRPENAIHQDHDIQWRPLLESPPHPEYVSGHSSFAGAGSFILQKIFQGDQFSFEATSDSLPGVVRKYESFQACADEMGQSRVFGGIHFSFSNKAGLELGRQVADYCWDKMSKFH